MRTWYRTPTVLVSRWLLVLMLASLGYAHASDDSVPRMTEERSMKVGAADGRLDSQLVQLLRLRPAARAAVVGPGPVRVYVRVAGSISEAVASLRAHGLTVEIANEPLAIVQGLTELDRLRVLAELPFVVAVSPAEEADASVGRATTEGDVVVRADTVRILGYDGSGTVVGVISDGIDHLADAVATGDLGAVTVPEESRCRRGVGDEGTALLEIVHDLAPGAALLFAGANTSLEFIDAVACLADAGTRVIVDDLSYFGEPYFEDGPMADAVRAAVQRGVSWHSSAGNYAQRHIEQPFTTVDGRTHQFTSTDAGADVNAPPGQRIQCVLQWDDPFGASANDYDLYLYRKGTNERVASSEKPQTGSQNPVEVLTYTNPGATTDHLFVVVVKASAAAVRTLMIVCPKTDMEHATPAGGIFAHHQLAEVVTVGAVAAATPGVVEPYSSQGPVLLPGGGTRDKPDLVAPDAVQISNAGGFPESCPASCVLDPGSSPDCQGQCEFHGTSAAAPHSAAVAALLLARNATLTPDHLQRLLTSTAVDLAPLGRDDASGYGRIDANVAVLAVCVDDGSCNDGNACTSDRCAAGLCENQPASCDDGDACNGAELCDPTSGCGPGTPLVGLALVRCELQAIIAALKGDSAIKAGVRQKLVALSRKAGRAADRASSPVPRRAEKALTRLGKTTEQIEKKVAKFEARGKVPGSLATGLLGRLGAVKGALAGLQTAGASR
jgi:subtilisin family serine protease